ncbi:MAG: Rpn family recombination-promoting nuclease/putative transposase [Clostridiaceae bacterium]|nr:Rpn family recombination-promoting nuclease/putative transposase [Clostridiaceae bacterium]
MNSLGAFVLSTEDGKAKYDQTMLNVLSDKQVLAWILKRFVSEYEHLSLEEIETKYIEPETILVSKAGVSRDSSGIKGLSEKDSTQTEGTVYYDIVFQAYYPGNEEEKIGLYINLEAQADYYPGYPLEMRGIYYGARRLTSQLKQINRETNYGCLQKVYSIWLCVGNVPAYESDTVTLYDISKNDIIGSVKRNKDFYDLINVVIIRLNDEAAPEDNTMKMLQTLFSNQLSKQEKLHALEKLGMRMNDSLEKGVGGSMNLSDYVELKGIEKGRRDGIRNMIELCQDLGTTEDNAKSQIIMRFRIPEEEAVKYIKTFWKSEK